MPPDQNTPPNPIPAENPSSVSPQEPTEHTPENTAHSEPSTTPPEAPESSQNVESAIPVNNANPQNEPISTPSPEEVTPEELPAEGEKTEKISEPAQTPEPQTAQMGRNEPFEVREILAKAQLAIQKKKRKKLDSILTLFAKRTSITNDEVEKFLHVSDATATRYLSILEKEGKIQQNGKTGKGVSYSSVIN